MIPSQYFFAFALVTGLLPFPEPPDTVPLDQQQGLWPLAYQLQTVCLSLDIMDRRECTYFFHRIDCIASDLQMMRARYISLKDAPPSSEIDLFPSAQACTELLSFNRCYRNHLLRMAEVFSADKTGIGVEINDLDHRYFIWDTIRDISCTWYIMPVKREAMKRLRQELGYEDYYAFRFPPVVDIDRFSRID